MNVGELMSRDVRTCATSDSLNDAARIMWEADCGCAPVVEADGTVVGMITDRDICMAAYTQGRRLMQMTVESTASKNVVTIGKVESLRTSLSQPAATTTSFSWPVSGRPPARSRATT